MFSQLGVPATGGAINGQRSPDSGQTPASLPIGLANVLHETRQHAANFDDFLLAKHELAARNDRGVRGELQVIFHLGRGRERHLQEFREVPVGRAAGPLGDVRRNRQGRALQLPNQAGVAPARDALRQAVDIQGDGVRFPPDGETAIVLHPIEATMVPARAIISRPPSEAIPRANR